MLIAQMEPIIQGATAPAWTFELVRGNNTPIPITGATFTGKTRCLESGVVANLDPTKFAIADDAGGIFTYSPAAGDVSTPGNFVLHITVTIGTAVYKARALLTIEADI